MLCHDRHDTGSVICRDSAIKIYRHSDNPVKVTDIDAGNKVGFNTWSDEEIEQY